jgi:ribosome recycling factor
MQHHAELFIGPHERCLAHIPDEYRTGPDVELIVADKLTIELARTLSVRAQSRPVEQETRHFIISCSEFLREAQNALLKLLEDPPQTARFSLIAPRASLLLPTLRSRLSLRVVAGEEAQTETVGEFLSAPYRVRLEQIAALQKAKDARGMRQLIADIERVVATTPEARGAPKDPVFAAQCAGVRVGSPKVLLEHLALSAPQLAVAEGAKPATMRTLLHMAYTFTAFDERAGEIHEWLSKEFATIRTGRAAPTLLDGVQVESYGARVPLNQAASVGVEDPRTLRVSPYDPSAVKTIEKAVTDADLGVSVSADETGVRVIFPELTGERRAQLLKIAKGKLEEARVSLRSARDEVVRDMEREERDGELTKDEKFRAKEALQKRVDDANEKLGGLLEKKEAEIGR